MEREAEGLVGGSAPPGWAELTWERELTDELYPLGHGALAQRAREPEGESDDEEAGRRAPEVLDELDIRGGPQELRRQLAEATRTSGALWRLLEAERSKAGELAERNKLLEAAEEQRRQGGLLKRVGRLFGGGGGPGQAWGGRSPHPPPPPHPHPHPHPHGSRGGSGSAPHSSRRGADAAAGAGREG